MLVITRGYTLQLSVLSSALLVPLWNKNELSCCTAVSFLCWNGENIFKTSLLVLSSLLLASIRLMFVDSPLATIDKTQLNTYMHAQYIYNTYTHIYIYVWMRIYCVIHDHVFCLHLSHLVGGFNPSTQPIRTYADHRINKPRMFISLGKRISIN